MSNVMRTIINILHFAGAVSLFTAVAAGLAVIYQLWTGGEVKPWFVLMLFFALVGLGLCAMQPISMSKNDTKQESTNPEWDGEGEGYL